MDPKQISFFQQYLLFPSVVALLTSIASAIATYYATYRLKKSEKAEDKRLQTENLIDKHLIEVGRLIPLFEKLRTDFDKDNFYSFRNIELISSVRWRLVGFNSDTILFNDDIRKETLEVTDTISTLVDELNALENNPIQGHNELKNKLNDAVRDDRAFRLELLKMGICLTNDGQGRLVPLPIGYKVVKGVAAKLDDKLQAIEDMRQNLISSVVDAQKQLDGTNADAARKRDRLVARIIDAQNKLKDLQTTFMGLVST